MKNMYINKIIIILIKFNTMIFKNNFYIFNK